MSLELWEELEWRGLNYQCSGPQSLAKLLASEPVTAYAGFDPTGPSLTTGNLLQMIKLRWLQKAGHRVIAIAGGGTGLIGDPSGKDKERPLLSKEEAKARVEAHRRELERILDFSPGPAQALLLDNADWLTGLDLIDFLRDIGKHFPLNSMLGRDSVKLRLGREQGITYTEFSFMLLQAYDFLHLYDTHGCRLQLGGSDQWGNITAGVELIRRMRGATAYALTSPLIQAGGKKISKSEGTAAYLSPELMSPYRFYQYWINTEDEDVVDYLKYYTFLTRGEIEELQRSVNEDPGRRAAQRALATEVTALVHGEEAAEAARRASEALFGSEIAGLDEATLLEVLADAPSITKPAPPDDAVVDLLVETGLMESRGQARRDLDSGGVYVNNVRVTDPDRRIGQADLLHGRYVMLRRGRRSYHLIRFA